MEAGGERRPRGNIRAFAHTTQPSQPAPLFLSPPAFALRPSPPVTDPTRTSPQPQPPCHNTPAPCHLHPGPSARPSVLPESLANWPGVGVSGGEEKTSGRENRPQPHTGEDGVRENSRWTSTAPINIHHPRLPAPIYHRPIAPPLFRPPAGSRGWGKGIHRPRQRQQNGATPYPPFFTSFPFPFPESHDHPHMGPLCCHAARKSEGSRLLAAPFPLPPSRTAQERPPPLSPSPN